MTKRKLIEKKIQEDNRKYGMNLAIGCFDPNVESISLREMKRIIPRIEGDDTDIKVSIRKKIHILEVSRVDNEVDFILHTFEEYINRYGSDYIEKFQ